jgi:anaerobic magnesium-protoporphyrin IX monomethyl ester cyclase
MDKILFIVPPIISFDSFVNPAFNERTAVKKSGNYGSVVTDMPLGLLSLSSFLKKHTAVEIKLIDFNIVLNKMENFEYGSFSDLFHDFLSTNEWIDYAPSIIGISTLFTSSYYNMIDVAGVARNIFPNALIIAGGGIPTNMYYRIFRDSTCFDALCYGEGEKPLLGLVQANDKNEFLRTHLSWIIREKVENKQSFQHDFIDNLDEIPFLDYDLLDTDDYRLNPIQSLFPLTQERKGIPIMTSRGCPHRCCFCSSHTVHGRKMRYHSINRVREDFKRLREQYGAETMVFFDDHLMADKQRFFEIINIMSDLQLTAFFPSSLALYALDRRVLEALKSIGVNNLVLSVESGSGRVLREIMHKPLDLSIVKRVITDCRQLGIASDVSILMGLPGETKQDIEDARSFLKTIDATWFRFSMATPLVGSEMFDVCIKNNYLKGDYISCDFKRAVIETEDFTTEYIQEKVYFLNLELNFVGNSNFKLGNYEIALKGFENTIRVKSDHAFAFYFAAKCCKMMNLDEKYLAYKARYQEIIEESAFWRNYANQFGLVALE